MPPEVGQSGPAVDRVVEVVSVLEAPIEAVWAAMLRPATFRFVTRGLLGASRVIAGLEKLAVGDRASGWIFLFHVIPLHRHSIEVVEVDRATFTVRTSEHGGVLHRWEHTLRAEQVERAADADADAEADPDTADPEADPDTADPEADAEGDARAASTRYRDIVAFDAGRLTALLVPLVTAFFRYRHRRWRRLAARLTW